MKKPIPDKSCLNCKKFAGCDSSHKNGGTICIDYIPILKAHKEKKK